MKTTGSIKFIADNKERDIIAAIADRAIRLFKWRSKRLIEMDVEATHCNGCPLRLSDLLVSDDFNFMHDIVGIGKHLNRDTGKLEGFFLPRFAQPKLQ